VLTLRAATTTLAVDERRLGVRQPPEERGDVAAELRLDRLGVTLGQFRGVIRHLALQTAEHLVVEHHLKHQPHELRGVPEAELAVVAAFPAVQARLGPEDLRIDPEPHQLALPRANALDGAEAQPAVGVAAIGHRRHEPRARPPALDVAQGQVVQRHRAFTWLEDPPCLGAVALEAVTGDQQAVVILVGPLDRDRRAIAGGDHGPRVSLVGRGLGSVGLAGQERPEDQVQQQRLAAAVAQEDDRVRGGAAVGHERQRDVVVARIGGSGRFEPDAADPPVHEALSSDAGSGVTCDQTSEPASSRASVCMRRVET
jgi:hypothetical protein